MHETTSVDVEVGTARHRERRTGRPRLSRLDVTAQHAVAVMRFEKDIVAELLMISAADEELATRTAHRVLRRHPRAGEVLGGIRWLTPRVDGGWYLEPLKPLGAVLEIRADGSISRSPDWPDSPQVHLNLTEARYVHTAPTTAEYRSRLHQVLATRADFVARARGCTSRSRERTDRRPSHARRGARRSRSRAGPGDDAGGDEPGEHRRRALQQRGVAV
jgi:hypothetical protein